MHAVLIADDMETADRLLAVLPREASVQLVLLTRAATAATDLRPIHLDVTEVVLLRGGANEQDVRLPSEAMADLVLASDLVVLDSSQRSRDIGGWLVGRWGLPIIWSVHEVTAGRAGAAVSIAVQGGTRRLLAALPAEGPTILLCRPGALASATGRIQSDPVPVREIATSLDAVPRVVSTSAAPRRTGPTLVGAPVIISVGRGIGGQQNVELYERLAHLLGAALGASRVAVDSGWLPFAHQVGQTGSVVAPKLYVAFGISGAIQHLAGMRSSKVIVAVNTDADAPICGLADLVIRADTNDVARTLLHHLDA